MNFLQKSSRFYIDSFRGFSREVWFLALITLINRAGTMVIPFLSLYLTDARDFSLSQVGWIMSAFGLGSVVGGYLGGVLNDKIGAYKTIILSLSSSGILFIVLQYMEQFWSISVVVFFVMLCADSFRPAMFVALKAYSKPSNQTRSVTLIRLAINLGFALGPAVGGFLIYQLGYGSLFWVDGITCLSAMLLFVWALNPKRSTVQQETKESGGKSAYKDGPYLVFCLGMIVFAFAFMQYFSTVPIYYRDGYQLSEEMIGLILGFNGFLVFLVEMPLIKWLEQYPKRQAQFISFGFFLLLGSFAVFNIMHHMSMLWIGIILMSFAEMLVFPFSNTYAMDRAKRGAMGQYMALYSMAFSVSHILAHNSGMQMIEAFDFPRTWWIFAGLSALGMLIFWYMHQLNKKDQSAQDAKIAQTLN